jgi:chromosome segregation ATPase
MRGGPSSPQRSRLVHSPRSPIDDLKLEKQGTAFPISARRRDLIASTSFKRKKELLQWIETDNPNGVEILDRLARSPSPFAALINRAVADFRIVERRAAALFERQFAEFSERQDVTAASVVELEAKLGKLQLDNRRIHDQIAREKADEQSLRDDVARLQAQLAPAPLAREDPETRPEDRELLDPVEFLNIERAKLEAALDLLESRLMELTQQQKELLQRPVRM